ncbi:mesoderm induction early response protein 1-like [Lampetra planeri]
MSDEEMFLRYDYDDPPPASPPSHVSTHSSPATRREDWSCRVSIPLTVTRPNTGVNVGLRSPKHRTRAKTVMKLMETGEKDGEESPSERKRIMIGPNYQAVVPERAEHRDPAVVAGERQWESLLWDPSVLPETTVASFLLHAQSRGGDDTYRVCDDEEALWHLMRAHFDSREALKRMSFAVKKDISPLCGWSKVEQRNFEVGMRMYGKNFRLIQSSKVRTRSVGECVCFYYLWKKELTNALPPSAPRGPGRPPRRRRRPPPQRDPPRWGSVRRTLGPALLPHVTLMALGPRQWREGEPPSHTDLS